MRSRSSQGHVFLKFRDNTGKSKGITFKKYIENVNNKYYNFIHKM